MFIHPIISVGFAAIGLVMAVVAKLRQRSSHDDQSDRGRNIPQRQPCPTLRPADGPPVAHGEYALRFRGRPGIVRWWADGGTWSESVERQESPWDARRDGDPAFASGSLWLNRGTACTWNRS